MDAGDQVGGKIIDGRRRWKACQLAGVEPATREVRVDDPVAYVLSLNLHRRHLTPSQFSMCAGRAKGLKDRLKAEAKERQRKAGGDRRSETAKSVPDNCPEPKAGDARDQLGALFGVSGK